jgi:hemerythrin-like domain-containing protein
MESIFERMREDHRRVLDEVAAMEQAVAGGADSVPAVRGLVALLGRQFGSHMAAEDEVLYPALMNALPETRASIEPLCADHGALRMMLSDLEETLSLPGDDREQMTVQVRDLADLLRIHIRKEEALVIGMAERVLRPAEVEALAARMNRGSAPSCGLGLGHGPSKGVQS